MIRAGDPPALRLVYWSREEDFPLVFRDFRLGVGRGNAGRAYKTCSVRMFDKARADENPKANTFVEAGGPDYQAVLSMPLLDPRTQQPLGVLNVGVTTRLAADLPAALTRPTSLKGPLQRAGDDTVGSPSLGV